MNKFKPILKPSFAEQRFSESNKLGSHYSISYSNYGCSLRLYDETKILRVNGGGFDKSGAAFGNLIMQVFGDLLPELYKKFGTKKTVNQGGGATYQTCNLLGLFRWRKGRKQPWNYWIDGAVGYSSIVRVFRFLGFKLYQLSIRHNTKNFYGLEVIKKWESVKL